LRLLFLPEETADGLIDGLKGAMDVRRIGDPPILSPISARVIDADAKAALDKHLDHLRGMRQNSQGT